MNIRANRLTFVATLLLCLRAGVPVLVGAEPRQTAWGELTVLEPRDASGGYLAKIAATPASGRWDLPADLQPVIFARQTAQSQPVYLPLVFESETGALAVANSAESKLQAGATFTLGYAATTEQLPDGTWLLPAQTAQVLGTTAKLETTGSHHRIGFWTQPRDEVAWKFTATRWGRYDVKITYSRAEPKTALARLQLDGQELRIPLPTTESWYQYATIPVGSVYIKGEGPQELRIIPQELAGSALMNLKAVFLQPAFESDERIVTAQDGTLTLPARSARIHGTKLRYEPKPEKNTLGYWTQTGEGATWEFTVDQPGKYTVEVLQGCGTGQGGSTMEIQGVAGTQPLTFIVAETGHFQKFVPRQVGQIEFNSGGIKTLAVVASKIAHAAACDIREIRLLPLK
ncbi:MAG: hypothetical protein SFX18_07450 [Pirellulales bacterium]|nr:hypothetical protein [Pirellulales bacterium]